MAFSRPVDEFDLQRALFNYLESEGYLQELATTGLKYLEAIQDLRSRGILGPSLCFRPELHLSKISKISAQLLNLILGEPALAEKLLQHLSLQIFNECLGATNLQGGLRPEQLYTPLRISCESAGKLLLKTETKPAGLVLITGVLSAYTSHVKYVRSCVVCCKNEGCPGSELKRHPGSWTKGQSCKYCNAEIVEVAEERDVGEETCASFLPLDGLNCGKRGKTAAKMIIFRDDLLADLKIGCQFQVICKRAVYQKSGSTLMACSRAATVLSPDSIEFGSFSQPLQRLYARCSNSPWAAVAAIAMNLGKEVVPFGSLFHIRMGAILSMASHGSHRPLPLLISGHENVLASKVLASAARLMPRSVVHSCQNALCGVAKKSEDFRQDLWIEAGSLLLASQGICFVGDWTGLKKETRTDIISAIEKGSITIKLPNKPLQFPMRASVWTHCHKLDVKSRKPLIDVFGMPLIADTTENENQQLAFHFLNNSLIERQTTDEEYLPESQIKTLLGAVGTIPVKMTQPACQLIKHYFVASRRARASGGSNTDECLPIGAVQNMSTMAEAHARLSMRSEAIPEDALVAIALYEQSMVSLFGPAFVAPPPPLDSASLSCRNLEQRVDDYMWAMHEWVNNFIKALIVPEES